MKLVPALSRVVDDTVKIFSPARALKREQQRAKIHMLGAYRGAERNRLRDTWLPGGDSADSALLPNLDLLRKRQRDLIRNDGTASGIINTVVVNTVGTGLNPQSRPDATGLGITDDQAKAYTVQAERVWKRFGPHADAQNRMDVEEMQSLIERQMLENGDVLVLPMRVSEPHRYLPLAFEVVEGDRVQTPNDLQGNGNIRAGVELGERGQPVAYWVSSEHPGDGVLTRSSRRNSQDFTRYPAFNPRTGEQSAFHLFWTKRPRQTRGEPFFAPVLTYFKDLADYMEAELVAARIQACFALIFETPDPYGNASGNSTGTDAAGRRLEEWEPGLVHYANAGEKTTLVQPTRPGNTFDPFVDKMFRMIGSSLGLPYELVMKDFSKTNYSSARAALLEARRFFRCRQQWLSKRFCQPIWEMVQREAWIQGKVTGVNLFQEDADLWLKARWIAPGWGWVDPLKEVRASLEAIDGGLSTLADECAAVGGKDWEETARQRKREQDLYEDEEIAGGPYAEPPAPATGAPAFGAPAQETEEPEEDEEQPEGEEEDSTSEAVEAARVPRFLFSDAKGNGHLVGAEP